MRAGPQVRAAGAKVVETGWSYGTETTAASSVATPGTAPVASAAPAVTQKTYQCWIAGFGGSYITPAFASSKDNKTLNADWNAYMQREHPSGRLLRARCQEMDPKQAAADLAQPGRNVSTGVNRVSDMGAAAGACLHGAAAE